MRAGAASLYAVPQAHGAYNKACDPVAAPAVAVLCETFARCPALALVACAELLRPESNQPLGVRLAAVRGTVWLLSMFFTIRAWSTFMLLEQSMCMA